MLLLRLQVISNFPILRVAKTKAWELVSWSGELRSFRQIARITPCFFQ